MATLYIRDTHGYHRAAPALILKTAQRLISRKFRPGTPVLKDPHRLRDFLLLQLAPREDEIFAAILLDNRHRLIKYLELFRGTLDTSTVHPREVVKEALAHNASAIILVHNHTTGDPSPSEADLIVTRRLKNALTPIHIQLLDHLVVGETITSFAERGLL